MSQSDTLPTLVSLTAQLYEGYATKIVNHMVNSGCISEDAIQDHYTEILSILSLGKPGNPIISSGNKVRRKKKKDPNAPKRPPSSFFLFRSAMNQKIKDALADEGVEITVPTVGRRAGEMWRAMSEDDKKIYREKWTAQNIIYKEELAAYKASKPADNPDDYEVVKPKRKRRKKSKAVQCSTEIPEEFVGEWLGPFDNTFLIGSIKNVVFSTLNEAIVAANERSDCVGVTHSKRGYTVRFGYKDSKRPEFSGKGLEGYEDLLYPSPNNETSFIKKSAADNYKVNGPNEKLSSSSDESVKVSLQKKKKKTKTKNKTKSKKTKTKANNSSTEVLMPDSDTEDDCGDATAIMVEEPVQETSKVNVSKVKIDGKDYYLDIKTSKVYDIKQHEFVGKLENGSLNTDVEDSTDDESSDSDSE